MLVDFLEIKFSAPAYIHSFDGVGEVVLLKSKNRVNLKVNQSYTDQVSRTETISLLKGLITLLESEQPKKSFLKKTPKILCQYGTN